MRATAVSSLTAATALAALVPLAPATASEAARADSRTADFRTADFRAAACRNADHDGIASGDASRATLLTQRLRPLGSGAQSTIGVQKLAALLVELAADDRTEAGVFPTDLPVTPIDAGGASPSYRPDTSSGGAR